jgi:uncharacterized protein
LDLLRHPEGGYFRELWRSDEMIETSRGLRNAGTAIYFLLQQKDFSCLHRLQSNECWFHLGGDMLLVEEIQSNGESITHHLIQPGSGFTGSPYCRVEAGSWFGAHLSNDDAHRKHGFALVSCTVAPGFDFRDFEMGERESLLKEYPQHEEIIRSLTSS